MKNYLNCERCNQKVRYDEVTLSSLGFICLECLKELEVSTFQRPSNKKNYLNVKLHLIINYFLGGYFEQSRSFY